LKEGNTMTYQSVNPNTGKTLKSFDELNDQQLEKALSTAESCFQVWKKTSYKERAAIVSKAAALIRANVDEFARLARDDDPDGHQARQPSLP
jgi:succinate-semialdehyde dehydrogenase/glutarate-semialdehyde dehydrogenase